MEQSIILTSLAAGEEASLAEGQLWSILLGMTLCFAAIHLFSHRIHHLLERHKHFFASFSAGLTVTYVFLHLFPSLEEAETLLGHQIHLITLLGFTIFYGIKSLVVQNSRRQKSLERGLFYVEIFFLAIYNALIIFTLPEYLQAVSAEIFLYLLAMGLHLLVANYKLKEKHHPRLYRLGCYALSLALFAGFIIDITIDPKINSLISSLLAAILAGFILFNVFVEELPHPKRSRFLWFVLGVGCYTVLLQR